LLRDLELQLAIRYDDETYRASQSLSPNEPAASARFGETAYTLGAKVSPAPWLMVRASFATGAQTPPLFALQLSEPEVFTGPFGHDPLRGGTPIGPYTLLFGGSKTIEAIEANTMSMGAILTPLGPDGPSLALDFSRIQRSHDIAGYGQQTIV